MKRTQLKRSTRILVGAIIWLALVFMAIGHDIPVTARITVTAYCPCSKCCGRYANTPDSLRAFADGTAFDRAARVCAVDPRFWNFGSVFTVPGLGDFTAHDTGRKIKGRKRIDLFMPSHAEAMEYGRRVYELEVVR